jgi:hypothetical protein
LALDFRFLTLVNECVVSSGHTIAAWLGSVAFVIEEAKPGYTPRGVAFVADSCEQHLHVEYPTKAAGFAW